LKIESVADMNLVGSENSKTRRWGYDWRH